MDIGRRSFLSFLIGGAAGTTLSPLPWKLTDDLSIWTQMWPWTPVPPDGETTYADTTCTLCPGGCGISVRKVEDRCVKIEGTAGHPINDGGICPLGASGLQLLYDPTRVTAPMKRVGEKGSGRFRAVSWDAALAEAADQLNTLRSEGRPQAVAWLSGAPGGSVSALMQRFMTAYGSPNFLTVPSIQDAYRATFQQMHGQSASVGFDVENSDFVLSFGSGIIEGWGSPVRMFRANSGWREGKGKVVQIEARLSNTAAKSDKWLPIRPGTEAALAFGIAHVLLLERRFRSDFVDANTYGFDNYKNMVMANYGPGQVEEITGVEKGTIVSLARNFAMASRPLAICGRGSGTTPASMNECMAVHALNALVGRVNQPGGIWTLPEPDYIAWPEPARDDLAERGLRQRRLDRASGSATGRLHRFMSAVADSDGTPIEVLFISEANPGHSQPDTETVRSALSKIPFVVSFSSCMDETAQQADLILPNHIYLERLEDRPTPWGFPKPMITLCQPVVAAPLHNTRHSGDVTIQLAQALGGTIAESFPWDSYQACLEETLEDRWEVLTGQGYWMDDAFAPDAWDSAFADGRIDFSGAGLRRGFAPVPIEGEDGAFPMLLIPYDSMRLTSGYTGDTPFLTKTVDDTVLLHGDVFVEINSQTAASAGLKEGGKARLSTPKGEAVVRVHLFDGIMPGVIALPRGLGHTADASFTAGKGVNVNTLIGPVEDPVSGLDAAWGIRAKLVKA